jgi:hypothetical protein
MDRRSFINKDFLNNTNKQVPVDDCECEIILITGKQNSKKTSSFHFATIAMMAFVCAIILSIVKIEAAKTNVTEFILVKKEKIISCAPGYTNKRKLNGNHEPTNGNDQNNCSHQQWSLYDSRRTVYLLRTNSVKNKPAL